MKYKLFIDGRYIKDVTLENKGDIINYQGYQFRILIFDDDKKIIYAELDV